MPKTIYLLRDRDRFKVGRSTNFARRQAAYRHMIPDAIFLLEIQLPDSAVIEQVEARAIAAISSAGFRKVKEANREWFMGDAEKAADILRQLLKSGSAQIDIAPFCKPIPRFPPDLNRRLDALFERHNKTVAVGATARSQQRQRDGEYAALAEEIRAFKRESLSRLSEELGLGSLLEPDVEFASYDVKDPGPCFRHDPSLTDGRSRSALNGVAEHRLDLATIIDGAGGGKIYDHAFKFYVGPIPYAVATASYVPAKEGFEALPAIEKALAAVGWRVLQIPHWHYYVTTRDLGLWLFVRNESPDELLASWRSSFVKWAEDNGLALWSRRDEWAGNYYENAQYIQNTLEDVRRDPFIPIEARNWSYVRDRSAPYAEVSPDDDLFGANGFSTAPLVARLFVWWEELGCPAKDDAPRLVR